MTGANISVRLSDEFLEAVSSESSFELRFPVDSKDPDMSEMIDANSLWDEIIERGTISEFLFNFIPIYSFHFISTSEMVSLIFELIFQEVISSKFC
mgnify:CR=1 FL=1